ncbi:hypothetical protein GCM10027020_35670 [Nocardioides salsibiostraticola]
MSDGDRTGGDHPALDPFFLDNDPDDPARAEAARREAERIAQERQEAARRMAAARAQIAEFDQGRRKGSKWGMSNRKARETSHLLEEMTREQTPPPGDPPSPVAPAASGGYQAPDYDRPDSRDAGREILAAFAETQAEAAAQAEAEADESSPRGLRGLTGRRDKDAGSPAEPKRSGDRPRLRLAGGTPEPPARPKPVAKSRDEPPAAATPATYAPSTRAPSPSRARGIHADRPHTGFSMNVDFKPRTMTRTILTLLLLLTLAATVFVGLTLVDDQNTLNVGLTAVLAAMALFIYSIRAGAAVSHLRVRGGLLEIKRGGRRDVFDLSSRFTPIDVIGRPSRAGWKVVMLRADGMPQLIDSSVVDPKHFSEVLEHYRPDLRPTTDNR